MPTIIPIQHSTSRKQFVQWWRRVLHESRSGWNRRVYWRWRVLPGRRSDWSRRVYWRWRVLPGWRTIRGRLLQWCAGVFPRYRPNWFILMQWQFRLLYVCRPGRGLPIQHCCARWLSNTNTHFDRYAYCDQHSNAEPDRHAYAYAHGYTDQHACANPARNVAACDAIGHHQTRQDGAGHAEATHYGGKDG